MVQIGGFDLVVLTDTKVTDKVYCHKSMGCDVVFSPYTTIESDIFQGGVGLVFRDRSKGWSIKSTLFHGPNVVSCEVVAGGKWTPLVGT